MNNCGIRPLFNVALSDEVDAIKSKCISLEKECNVLVAMNTKLQEAIVLKDACIIERNKELAELKAKFERLRCTVYTDNSTVIANLLEENKMLKATLLQLDKNND